MPWLVHHNPEIDWKTGEVKMMRCPEECGKQWRPKQGVILRLQVVNFNYFYFYFYFIFNLFSFILFLEL